MNEKSETKIRVLIADPSEFTLAGLKQILERDPLRVAELRRRQGADATELRFQSGNQAEIGDERGHFTGVGGRGHWRRQFPRAVGLRQRERFPRALHRD